MKKLVTGIAGFIGFHLAEKLRFHEPGNIPFNASINGLNIRNFTCIVDNVEGVSRDLPSTQADVTGLIEDMGCKPYSPIEMRIERFVEWNEWYFGMDNLKYMQKQQLLIT